VAATTECHSAGAAPLAAAGGRVLPAMDHVVRASQPNATLAQMKGGSGGGVGGGRGDDSGGEGSGDGGGGEGGGGVGGGGDGGEAWISGVWRGGCARTSMACGGFWFHPLVPRSAVADVGAISTPQTYSLISESCL